MLKHENKTNLSLWEKIHSRRPFITKGQILLVALFLVILGGLTAARNGFFLPQIKNINQDLFSGDKFGLKEFASRINKNESPQEPNKEVVSSEKSIPEVRGKVLGAQAGGGSEPFEIKDLKEPDDIQNNTNNSGSEFVVHTDNFFSVAAGITGGAISTAVDSLVK